MRGSVIVGTVDVSCIQLCLFAVGSVSRLAESVSLSQRVSLARISVSIVTYRTCVAGWVRPLRQYVAVQENKPPNFATDTCSGVLAVLGVSQSIGTSWNPTRGGECNFRSQGVSFDSS